jgi:hypothetical protein
MSLSMMKNGEDLEIGDSITNTFELIDMQLG